MRKKFLSIVLALAIVASCLSMVCLFSISADDTLAAEFSISAKTNLVGPHGADKDTPFKKLTFGDGDTKIVKFYLYNGTDKTLKTVSLAQNWGTNCYLNDTDAAAGTNVKGTGVSLNLAAGEGTEFTLTVPKSAYYSNKAKALTDGANDGKGVACGYADVGLRVDFAEAATGKFYLVCLNDKNVTTDLAKYDFSGTTEAAITETASLPLGVQNAITIAQNAVESKTKVDSTGTFIDFEGDADLGYMTKFGKAVTSISSAHAKSGNYALKLVGGEYGYESAAFAAPAIAVISKAGNYRVTGSVFFETLPGTSGARPGMTLNYRDTKNNYQQSSANGSSFKLTDDMEGKWVDFDLNIVLPGDTSKSNTPLGDDWLTNKGSLAFDGIGAGCVAYFDDLKVEVMPEVKGIKVVATDAIISGQSLLRTNAGITALTNGTHNFTYTLYNNNDFVIKASTYLQNDWAYLSEGGQRNDPAKIAIAPKSKADLTFSYTVTDGILKDLSGANVVPSKLTLRFDIVTADNDKLPAGAEFYINCNGEDDVVLKEGHTGFTVTKAFELPALPAATVAPTVAPTATPTVAPTTAPTATASVATPTPAGNASVTGYDAGSNTFKVDFENDTDLQYIAVVGAGQKSYETTITNNSSKGAVKKTGGTNHYDTIGLTGDAVKKVITAAGNYTLSFDIYVVTAPNGLCAYCTNSKGSDIPAEKSFAINLRYKNEGDKSEKTTPLVQGIMTMDNTTEGKWTHIDAPLTIKAEYLSDFMTLGFDGCGANSVYVIDNIELKPAAASTPTATPTSTSSVTPGPAQNYKGVKFNVQNANNGCLIVKPDANSIFTGLDFGGQESKDVTFTVYNLTNRPIESFSLSHTWGNVAYPAGTTYDGEDKPVSGAPLNTGYKTKIPAGSAATFTLTVPKKADFLNSGKKWQTNIPYDQMGLRIEFAPVEGSRVPEDGGYVVVTSTDEKVLKNLPNAVKYAGIGTIEGVMTLPEISEATPTPTPAPGQKNIANKYTTTGKAVNYMISANGFFSGLKDGKNTVTYTFINDSNHPMQATLSVQGAVKDENGKPTWQSPGGEKTVKVGAKRSATLTYSFNVSGGKVTILGQEVAIGDLFLRLNINGENGKAMTDAGDVFYLTYGEDGISANLTSTAFDIVPVKTVPNYESDTPGGTESKYIANKFVTTGKNTNYIISKNGVFAGLSNGTHTVTYRFINDSNHDMTACLSVQGTVLNADGNKTWASPGGQTTIKVPAKRCYDLTYKFTVSGGNVTILNQKVPVAGLFLRVDVNGADGKAMTSKGDTFYITYGDDGVGEYLDSSAFDVTPVTKVPAYAKGGSSGGTTTGGDSGTSGGSTVACTGIVFTIKEDVSKPYFITKTGIIDKSMVKDGEITIKYQIFNESEQDITLKPSLQTTAKKSDGTATWAGPGYGEAVEIAAGESEWIEVTVEVNDDNTITVLDEDYALSKFFLRLDFSCDLEAGTKFVIACTSKDSAFFTGFNALGKSSWSAKATLDTKYGTGDALPVAIIAVVAVAAVALFVVAKKKKEEI